MDWSRPQGPRLSLPVVRWRASDPGHRIGTLVVNYGGPGEQHAQELLQGPGPLARLGRRFDLVAFDTRDTLLRCGENLTVHEDQLPRVVSNTAQFAERVRFNRALAASCRTYSGALFDHIDAVAIARDTDALRELLTERQLSFYGVSYGTLVAQMYREQFPARVRAMVLDSVVDHSLDPPALLTGAAEAQEDTYRAARRWCSRSPHCALHGQDIDARMDAWFAAASARRLEDDGIPIDTGDLLARTYLGNMTEDGWAGFFQMLSGMTIRSRPFPPHRPLPLPAQPGDPVSQSRPTPLLCADWTIGPRSYTQERAWRQKAERAAPHTHGNSWYHEWAMRCAGWPRTTSNPPHPPRPVTAPPVLLVNARHDPATSPAWARHVAAQLPHASLLMYQGAGHFVASVGGDCPHRWIARYLEHRALPPAHTACPAYLRPSTAHVGQVPPHAADVSAWRGANRLRDATNR
ncbi:alpha/beta hydrolase [Streptomyces chartreusis]|uniref:alpha/beta hydrolase n=1 Tax=Streptomyces chartreusis TaxID=1969 RepID=UPI002E17CBE8